MILNNTQQVPFLQYLNEILAKDLFYVGRDIPPITIIMETLYRANINMYPISNTNGHDYSLFNPIPLTDKYITESNIRTLSGAFTPNNIYQVGHITFNNIMGGNTIKDIDLAIFKEVSLVHYKKALELLSSIIKEELSIIEDIKQGKTSSDPKLLFQSLIDLLASSASPLTFMKILTLLNSYKETSTKKNELKYSIDSLIGSL